MSGPNPSVADFDTLEHTPAPISPEESRQSDNSDGRAHRSIPPQNILPVATLLNDTMQGVAMPTKMRYDEFPISNLGVANPRLLVKEGDVEFKCTGSGYLGNRDHLDSEASQAARMSRLKALTDGVGANQGAHPEVQRLLSQGEQVVAILDCCEVYGLPHSASKVIKGVCQVALVEDNKGVRRLLLLCTAGSVEVIADEEYKQSSETKCCLCPCLEGSAVDSSGLQYKARRLETNQFRILNLPECFVDAYCDTLHQRQLELGTGAQRTQKWDCCHCCCCCCLWCKCCHCCCDCDCSSSGTRSLTYALSVIQFFWGFSPTVNRRKEGRKVFDEVGTEWNFQKNGSNLVRTTVKKGASEVKWNVRDEADLVVCLVVCYRSTLDKRIHKCFLVLRQPQTYFEMAPRVELHDDFITAGLFARQLTSVAPHPRCWQEDPYTVPADEPNPTKDEREPATWGFNLPALSNPLAKGKAKASSVVLKEHL